MFCFYVKNIYLCKEKKNELYNIKKFKDEFLSRFRVERTCRSNNW